MTAVAQEISEPADIPGLGGDIIAYRQGRRLEWALNLGWYSGRGGGRVVLFPFEVDALHKNLGIAADRLQKLEFRGNNGSYKEAVTGSFSKPEIEIEIRSGQAFVNVIFHTTTSGNYGGPRNHFLSRTINIEEIQPARDGLRRASQRGPGLVDRLAELGPPTPESACFIATACLGDINHPSCTLLRGFRDDVLQDFFIGRMFIHIYYAGAGQFLSEWISTAGFLKTSARLLLIQPTLLLAFLCSHIYKPSEAATRIKRTRESCKRGNPRSVKTIRIAIPHKLVD